MKVVLWYLRFSATFTIRLSITGLQRARCYSDTSSTRYRRYLRRLTVFCTATIYNSTQLNSTPPEGGLRGKKLDEAYIYPRFLK